MNDWVIEAASLGLKGSQAIKAGATGRLEPARAGKQSQSGLGSKKAWEPQQHCGPGQKRLTGRWPQQGRVTGERQASCTQRMCPMSQSLVLKPGCCHQRRLRKE